MKRHLHVAIAVLLQHQCVLVGWRDQALHQGGRYEFSGGKIEQGESPMEACRREVFEEVGIDLPYWKEIENIQHEYDEVIVTLHVFQAVVPFSENVNIRSVWTWKTRDELKKISFPKANQHIIDYLYWQPYIKISHQLQDIIDIEQHLAPLDTLYYWRCDLTQAAQHAKTLDYYIDQYPAIANKLIINESVWQQCTLKTQKQIKTIHLKHHQLMNKKTIDQSIGVRYLAACHDQSSLEKAVQCGCDAVLCSPVLSTLTHQDVPALGWQKLAEWIHHYPLPVFALGGLTRKDLALAQHYGAYGIAGIRGI